MTSGGRSDDEWRENLESRVRDLEAFRNWIVGAAAAIGALFGIFADAVKRRLGIS